MTTEHTPTLERIRSAAEAEFLKYGFRSASLRRIVRSVGMTTGACFTGYTKVRKNCSRRWWASITIMCSPASAEAQEAFGGFAA